MPTKPKPGINITPGDGPGTTRVCYICKRPITVEEQTGSPLGVTVNHDSVGWYHVECAKLRRGRAHDQ